MHPKVVPLRNICMFNVPPNLAHSPWSPALETRPKNDVWRLQVPGSGDNPRFYTICPKFTLTRLIVSATSIERILKPLMVRRASLISGKTVMLGNSSTTFQRTKNRFSSHGVAIGNILNRSQLGSLKAGGVSWYIEFSFQFGTLSKNWALETYFSSDELASSKYPLQFSRNSSIIVC